MPEDRSTRTFELEDSLPRVPLPTLVQSCARFLEWCAPLLTSDELDATRAAVADFLRPDSPSHLLQAALVEFDATGGVSSWLDAFWRDRYLGRRDRIALNANFFFLFNDAGLGQVERASALIAAAVDYKLAIDEQRLPPAFLRGRPLSMDQYRYLYSATRIPGRVVDSACTPYSAEWPGPSRERHVVVFRRGHMFRMDVITPAGRRYTSAELAAGLYAVLAAAPDRAEADTSVGHLTTKARADWAASRTALRACDPANMAALDTIETALFCVCLEDGTPADPLAAGDRLLSGDDGNRWFDKAISLIVFEDGTSGLNGEHCHLDGTTILSFIDSVVAAPGTRPSDAGAPAAIDPHVAPGIVPALEPVRFVLDDRLRADIRAAAEAFTAYAADTATTALSLRDFGADTAKGLLVSPDAFVQLAYQLSHRRTRGMVGATYESIATRQFRHGRTEAMRVVTPEIVEFVAAMDDPQADDGTRRAALRVAAIAHVARARDCQEGRAPEQHLWELQMIQRRLGNELGAAEPLALYESPGWRIMREDYLSTSSVPSANVQYFGFGSTSRSCIGIGYVLLPDRLNLYLSTPRSAEAQLHTFAVELRRAIAEMQGLLAAEPAGGDV